MNGIRLIELMTTAYRKHKSQGKRVRFCIVTGNQRTFYHATKVIGGASGLTIELRRTVD